MISNNLIKSFHKDTDKVFFKKIDLHIKRTIGHKLLTFTVIDKSIKYVERIYSSNQKVYPLLGQKAMPKNIWSKKVLKNRNHFLCKTKREIKKIYFDHKIIFSLKCGSMINLLINFNNKPIGTVNILHKENHFTNNDIKTIEDITIYLIPFCLIHQLKMKNKLK